MSPTSTSEGTAPRRAGWRGLPLGGLAADIGVFVLVSLGLSLLVLVATMSPPLAAIMPAGGGRQLLAIALLVSLGASLALYGLRARTLAPLASTLPLPRAIAWGLLGGLLLQGLAKGLSDGLELAGLPLNPGNRGPVLAMFAAAPWLTAVFVVLVGPWAEELAFRHVMLRRFANAGRPLAGLLLTAGLFSLAHELGPGAQSFLAWMATTLVYFLVGLGLGGLYLRTGRMATSLAAHAAMNAAGLALLAYSTR